MQKSEHLRSNSSRQAFTLIEVIVTIGIALTAMSLALVALIYGVNASKSTRAANKRNFEIMKVYPKMRKQLLCMYKNAKYSKSFIELNGDAPHTDSMRFLTTYSAYGRKTFVEAFYTITRQEDGSSRLCYHEYPLTRDMIETEAEGYYRTESPEIISDFVTGMDIKCESGEKAPDPWEGNEIPEKITVVLYYEEKGKEQIFSFSVKPTITLFKK